MSKELTPLEAFNKIASGGCKGKYHKYCEIVETALKDYEEGLDNAKTYVKRSSSQALYDLLGLAIKNVYKSFWKLPRQLFDDVNKSLKALEIIKKEISDCLEFYYDEEHDYGEVWCVQNEEESRVLIASANSKEEYDLLKEVLCNGR